MVTKLTSLKNARSGSFPAPGMLREESVGVLKSSSKAKKEVRVGGAAADAGKKNGTRVTMKLKKELGQHLLKNPGIVNKILAAADVKKSDVVLEIGPGTGNLTVKLCGMARRVRALELDTRMIAEVKKRVLKAGYSNLEIVQGDALKQSFGQFNVCTANLPYQISSPFVFRLASIPPTFRAAILMFQKEFGDRLISKPHDKTYGRLAVNTQLFFDATRVCNVDAASFNPPPKVDSVVIKLVPRKQTFPLNYGQWDGMLRVLFGRKNRTLGASVTRGKIVDVLKSLHEAVTGETIDHRTMRQRLRAVLESLEYTEKTYATRRAIELDIPDLIRVMTAFHKANILFPVSSTKRNLALVDAMAAKSQGIPGADVRSIPAALFCDVSSDEEEDEAAPSDDEHMADE